MSKADVSSIYSGESVKHKNNVVLFATKSALAEKSTFDSAASALASNSVHSRREKKAIAVPKIDATSFANRYLKPLSLAFDAPSAGKTFGFAPAMSKSDLQMFHAGHHLKIQDILGAHVHREGSVEGVRFAVWAPAAKHVSVSGEFNQWNIFAHPMQRVTECGVWETFVPDLTPGMLYKFNITRQDGYHLLKTDPYGRAFEMRPNNASIITAPTRYQWNDQQWLDNRSESQAPNKPLSIYEVHLGSWQRDENNNYLNYRELAHRLADYVKDLGFTHVELMPITEYPLDESWGYQTTGYFAPTSRFGSPDDFRYFVDHLHQQGIGIILDWVPAHFPRDDYALARFDGTALYEYPDSRLGEHLDWGTYIPNYARNEVRNFFLASALFWLDEYHIDGLRVDAVASMLYRDYSREGGDWLPNIYGGNENLEAISFLRELTQIFREQKPGTLVIAEESTSWAGVTAPVEYQGLGFSHKWNMGWMHDTLAFMQTHMADRVHAQNRLTFSGLYAWSEKFMLSFSHDEVVHEKHSLLHKMPGSPDQQYENLKLLYLFMYVWPGAKLLFMGNEFGQRNEWRFYQSLDWHFLDAEPHRQIRETLKSLNHLYRDEPSLHQWSYEPRGFQWIDCSNPYEPILALQRNSEFDFSIALLNFGEHYKSGYRLGVPEAGNYQVIFSTRQHGEHFTVKAEEHESHNNLFSIELDLPPLTGFMLKKV
jgi:1,4-alpha-glucan branching enzyme